ncbi:MAG: HAD-IA family hydrolase [Deltaproteobacteria bacterium]|nr:HAD-IA family hydrolase [Deltaproteobacteria bacterium]
MTLYIFDMGGVVSRNCDVFPDILSHLDISQEEFLLFAGENLEKLFNGEISTDEFWARFSRQYGKEVREELFGKFFHPSVDREVIALITQLKVRSRVVCGTNTFDPHYDYHLSHGDYVIFDAVFASNKIGLSKPDPEFYMYILKSEAVNPEKAFFVDDTEVNVFSAERMGINAILFKDSKSLGLQIKNHQRSSGTFLP